MHTQNPIDDIILNGESLMVFKDYLAKVSNDTFTRLFIIEFFFVTANDKSKKKTIAYKKEAGEVNNINYSGVFCRRKTIKEISI